jgi:hypothetical protein
VAALSLSNYSTKQNSYSKALNDATSYNSQVADWLRSEKTRLGWAVLVDKLQADTGAGTATYCLTQLPSGSNDFTSLTAGNCDPTTDFITGTVFVRELTLITDNIDSGSIAVTVTTSWEEKTTRQATLNMEISKWQ